MANAGGRKVAGRYRLEERIGRGGMGEVWRAYDETLKRPVALKSPRTDDERAIRRLKVEAEHAAQLHHPNIVEVFDIVDDQGICWIVMEFVAARPAEGRREYQQAAPSLARLIRDRGALPPGEALAIGRQLADALAASHTSPAGIVHADLTPENVLVRDDGTAKLTDFGISRAIWTDPTQVGDGTGGVRGKLRFMPPEVLGGGPNTEKSDVFSLGATLFAAVEGRPPWGELDSELAYLDRVRTGRTEPPRQAGPLTPVLTAMLDAEPAERPGVARVQAMLSGLVALLTPEGPDLNGAITDTVDTDPRPVREPEAVSQPARQPQTDPRPGHDPDADPRPGHEQEGAHPRPGHDPDAVASPGDGPQAAVPLQVHEPEVVPPRVHEPDPPEPSPRTPGRRAVRWPGLRRRHGLPAAAGLLAVLAVGAVVTQFWPDRDGHGTPIGHPAPEPARHRGEMGDVHTADPCGLLSTKTFGRFGDAEMDMDYGELDRCDVLLQTDDGEETADVKLDFATDLAEPDSQARTRKAGVVTVVELPQDDEECERNIRLPDGNQIWITGDKHAPKAPEPCSLADAATDHAVDLLNRGPVPRRPSPFPADSLALRKACDLLDAGALSVLDDVHAQDGERGFADWDCSWSSRNHDDGVDIRFNRDDDLTDNGEPTHLAGAESYVASGYDGDHSCTVFTVHRTYRDTAGDHTIEYVELTTYGRHPADRLCDTAEELSSAVVKKLRAS